MNEITANSCNRSRRSFLRTAAVSLLVIPALRSMRSASLAGSQSPLLCSQSCCVDSGAPLWPDGYWFEQGNLPTEDAFRCYCGYRLGYRVHPCTYYNSSLNLRQRQIGTWCYEDEIVPVYSCNGLHEEFWWLDINDENYHQLQDEVWKVVDPENRALMRPIPELPSVGHWFLPLDSSWSGGVLGGAVVG